MWVTELCACARKFLDGCGAYIRGCEHAALAKSLEALVVAKCTVAGVNDVDQLSLRAAQGYNGGVVVIK